jgi:hypothetical protein
MAIIKCHGCGKQVSDEMLACPYCGALRQPRPDGQGFENFIFTFLLLVTLGAVVGVGMLAQKNAGPADRTAQATSTKITPQDDPEHFIVRYGLPDIDDCTEHDTPQPHTFMRFLIYEAERVRVVYVADAPADTSGPFPDWKFVAFQDYQDNRVLTASEVERRLEGRARQLTKLPEPISLWPSNTTTF